jgi:WD40 repeat protein
MEKSAQTTTKEDNNNSYEFFNISQKQLILKRKCHTDKVTCLCLLDGGRLVSGSKDNNIIIFNKKTYDPDLTIKEHKDTINCIIKLDSNILASCSSDKTIKIYKIQDNQYEIVQTLIEHTDRINKIIELKNKNLVSCSNDNSIIIYHKTNDNKYEKDYQISTNGWCQCIIQTKENEICYSELEDDFYNIHFYDLNERKITASISEINITGAEPFNMITKDLLIVGGYNEMYVIDVNKYKLIRTIDIPDAGLIFGFCKLNENMFLIGGEDAVIRQWKMEGDEINLFSKKEEADNCIIFGLIKIGDGKIATFSDDESIKIW